MSNNWHILGDLLKNGKSKKIQIFLRNEQYTGPGRNRTRGFKKNQIFVNRGEMGIPDLNKDLNVSSNRNVSLLRNSLITRRNTSNVGQILLSWNGRKCPFQDMSILVKICTKRQIDNCWTIVRFGQICYKYSKMSNNGQKEIRWRMSLRPVRHRILTKLVGWKDEDSNLQISRFFWRLSTRSQFSEFIGVFLLGESNPRPHFFLI